MAYYEFRVDLDPVTVQRTLYTPGDPGRVSVLTTQGLRLELPIARLRPFVTSEGVHGFFGLTLDGSRFVSMEKISD